MDPSSAQMSPLAQAIRADWAPVTVSMNYKGGVGKTLSLRVLAQGLAELPWFHGGKPILIIDLDPQGNTSRRWNLLTPVPDSYGDMMPKPHPALADEAFNYSSVCDIWGKFLGGESVVPEPYETANPLIHVVPADERLMRRIMQLDESKVSALGGAMRQWLRSPEIAERYSCVLIDTAPSKSNLIDAALTASTHIYIPFVPEPQSVEGVFSILSYVTRFGSQRGNDVPMHLLGILPNIVQPRTSLHQTMLKQIKDSRLGEYLMPVKLDRRIPYAETDASNITPQQVTEMGPAIAKEARQFITYMAKAMKETSASSAGQSQRA